MIVLVDGKQIAVVGGLITKAEASQMLLDDVNESQITLRFSDFSEVRRAREPLLKEADDLINMAGDNDVNTDLFRHYRQELRDITSTYNNPEDVVWPQKPSLPQASA
ncbi:phage tail assembly chaperone [Vibrio lentus]|uniref:phage tail assembly chaperone n=1 Tax=Vibrio lentus TaxID=136468 RepID=UPI0030B9A208